MTATVATYIAFPGTTTEAFTHWHEVFGGELNMVRYGDMPMEGMPFEPDPQAVAHVTLTLPGGSILAGGDAMEDGNDYVIRDTAYSLLYTLPVLLLYFVIQKVFGFKLSTGIKG